MSSPNFPSTGLVPNETKFTVGALTYLWDGEKWRTITAKLSADQITYEGVKNVKEQVSENNDVIRSLLTAQGLSGNYGFFEDGFNYQFAGDVGIDPEGVMWTYVGAGAPNKVVAAGTVPSVGAGYQQVNFNALQQLSGLDQPSDLDKKYSRESTVAEVATGVFSAGSKLKLSDRSGTKFEVVSGGTPNGFGVIDAGNGNTARIVGGISLVGLGVLDDGTIQSSEIINALATVATNGKMTVIYGNPGVYFNAEEVIKNINKELVIKCDGCYVGNNSFSYFQKFFGIIAADDVDNDSAIMVETGHNPAYALINHRTSNTTSADKGFATTLYSLGRFDDGQTRNVGLQQWGNPTGSLEHWVWSLRKLLPWSAVADKGNMAFLWKASPRAVNAGDYCTSNSKVYKAVSSGTTGLTKPDHSSGVVSDGGVNWEYVSSGDATIFTVNELGQLGLNSNASSFSQINLEQSIDDGASSYNLSLKPTGSSKISAINMYVTDSQGDRVPCPIFRAGDGYVQLSNSNAGRFYEDRIELGNVSFKSKTVSGSSFSCSGASKLVVNNASSTTITDITGAVTDVTITLMFTDSNTTVKNGGGIKLSGNIDFTPTPFSTLTLAKISAGSYTSAWVEVSRSLR